ncbi:MAG: helix-turn-helix domain-containing protein [Bacteroidota bacterium]
MEGIYDYRLPHPALREYVRLFQIVGCTFPSSMKDLPVKPYWPRAENCLSFFPKDPEKVVYGFDGKPIVSATSRLYGQHSIVTNRHVGQDFMVFQVQFQPGALARLTGMPVCNLTNTFVDAETIFSKEIKAVNERLSYTKHYTEMIPIVEEFLVYLIKRQSKNRYKNNLLPIDRVNQFILEKKGIVSLDWLASQTCLSTRQFHRQFIERHGISPKLYSRITRFEYAIKLKHLNAQKDWLTVAIELGYYDYQHLVRDFKEFTTLTPNQFLVAEESGPERTFGMVEV